MSSTCGPSATRRLALCAAVILALLGFTTRAALADDGCGSAANPIVCENQQPGEAPSDWEVSGVGDATIQGFATSMSVDVGKTISFKIDTPSTSYHIDILRLGWYGGDGARLVASDIRPSASLPQSQPACLTTPSTGLIDCGNWGVSASWTVPSDAVSGVYIAHLVRDDSSDPGGASQIPFVVRDDASHSTVLAPTSDATWEAYNDYGGNSLYTCTVNCPAGTPGGYKAAYAVSYNRPWDGSLVTDSGDSYLWYAEYQMIQFLEKNGYDVSYTDDADMDSQGSLLLNHKVILFSGHDEYWSANERANVLAARNAGVNLAMFTGNEIFWKTRWAASSDGSNTPYRTLVTYKETHFNEPVDPDDPPTWTGAWADPRFSPPADGGNPANALSGQEFEVNQGTSDITVPAQYSKLRVWQNTSVAKLAAGQSVTLGAGDGDLGYEWDVDADNGFRPAGEFDLSSTTVSGLQSFVDYGTYVNSIPTYDGNPVGVTTEGGTETHNLTLYRASSGALVFGAGTVQWSWGLDNFNAWGEGGTEPSQNAPDPNMEQFTVNLLSMMGAQPGSLQSGLQPGPSDVSTTPPRSSISSPTAGSSIQDGSVVTITGSASDSSGGVVAGVEVSTNGGSSWHPTTLTTPDGTTVGWSYSWIAHGYPSTKIESRAVDDSGNLETPSDATTVSINCPCSLWGTSETPLTVPFGLTDSGDPNSVTVGVKFTTSIDTPVTGIRFYKASTNTGTHVGSLWNAAGALLAQGTFANESASGWQTLTFSAPVEISPGTTYVAGYYAPNGHYAGTPSWFYPPPAPSPLGGATNTSGPWSAVIATGSNTNGMYTYGSASTFPTSTSGATNYWVDVVFAPPGTGSSATAAAPVSPGTKTAPGSTTGSSSSATTGAPGLPATKTRTKTAPGSRTGSKTNAPYTGLEIRIQTRADTAQISVSNSAPHPILTLTGPRRLTPALNRSGEARIKLRPGYWKTCARSGGGKSGHPLQTACKSFEIKASQDLRLARPSEARNHIYVALSASSVAFGHRAVVLMRYYARSCPAAPARAGQRTGLSCPYTRLVYTATSTVTLRSGERLVISERWWKLGPRLAITVTSAGFSAATMPVGAETSERVYCGAGSCGAAPES